MEFYVEGLRSRTLKSLTPKLGKYYVNVCKMCDYLSHCGLSSTFSPQRNPSPTTLLSSYFVSYIFFHYFLLLCVGVVYFRYFFIFSCIALFTVSARPCRYDAHGAGALL